MAFFPSAAFLVGLGCLSSAAAAAPRTPPRRPPRLAAAAVGRCQRALELSDFAYYDVVADGRLHRSELSKAKRRCLVSQFILTGDRNNRWYFQDRLQNRLWEAIRRALLKAKRDQSLSATLRRRLVDLLNFEFAERAVRGWTALYTRIMLTHRRDIDVGEAQVERFALYQLIATGVLSLNLRFGRWRLRHSTWLVGHYNHGQRGVQVLEGSANSTREVRNTVGSSGGGSFILDERSGRLKVTGGLGVTAYSLTMADQLNRRLEAWGSAKIHRPFGKRLSARLTGSWRADRYTAPWDEDHNQRRVDTASVNAELSYRFGRFGLLGSAIYSDTDAVTAFQRSRLSRTTGALLGHLSLPKGWIRFGVGGGEWSERLQLLKEPAPSRAGGAQTQAYLTGRWTPMGLLSFTFKAVASALLSEGDFNGWYPSWSTTFTGQLSHKVVTVKAVAAYSGYYRDLDLRQTLHAGSATLGFTFHGSDRWKAELLLAGSRRQILQHQANDQATWTVVIKAGTRLLRRPDVWLDAQLAYSGSRYREDELARDLHYGYFLLNCLARF